MDRMLGIEHILAQQISGSPDALENTLLRHTLHILLIDNNVAAIQQHQGLSMRAVLHSVALQLTRVSLRSTGALAVGQKPQI